MSNCLPVFSPTKQPTMSLIYCNKKHSNTSRCANIAVFKGYHTDALQQDHIVWRCDSCKNQKTVGQKGKSLNLIPFDQSEEMNHINQILLSFVGNPVFSRHHRNKYPFTGKYLKPNGAIMCTNDLGKWFLVYYKQLILES